MNVYRMWREEGGAGEEQGTVPGGPDALPCQSERFHWQGRAVTGTPQPGPGSWVPHESAQLNGCDSERDPSGRCPQASGPWEVE